jgi:hypothetical protein
MPSRRPKIQEGEGLLQRSMSGPPLSTRKTGMLCVRAAADKHCVRCENKPVD